MLNSNLPERLKICTEKAGGKRALAQKTGVSESQIFRYLNGTSEPSLEKLEKISAAANVRAAWLLAGDGEPDFEPTISNYSMSPASRRLLSHLIKLFEEALMEYQGNYTVDQKSLIIPLLMRAAQHEIDEGRPQPFTNNRSMHRAMYFLEGLKSSESLAILHNMLDVMEQAQEAPDFKFSNEVEKFVNLICKSNVNYWDFKMGELCFERVGSRIDPKKKAYIHQIISKVLSALSSHNKINTLDLGCGNGRYVTYFNEVYPKLHIQGVDASTQSFSECQKLEKSGKVKEGTFSLAELRQLPYTGNSFDFVYCFNVFQYLPFLMGSGCGAEAAVKEISRVLTKGGIVYLGTPYGQGREYLPYLQYFNEKSATKLLEPYFNILHMERVALPLPEAPGCTGETKYLNQLHILMRK